MLDYAYDRKKRNNPVNTGRRLLRFNGPHSLLFLLLLAVLIRLPLIIKPFDYGGDDAWREADTASIAHNFYHEGHHFNVFYPQVNWGGIGPGYVETEFQLYPFITSLTYLFFGEQVWLGRLVSALFSIATLTLIYKCSRRLMYPRAAFWATAFLVIAPLYVRYSTAFMPEATVLFFYVLALFLFQKWLDKPQLRSLILAGLCAALAILVKPTSIHIGLIFFLLLFQRHGPRLVVRREVWLFGIISLLPGTLWYLHARNLYLTYGNTFGLFSGGDTKFGNVTLWLTPSFYWRLAAIDTKWVFAVGGILLFLLGLVVALRHRRRVLLYGVIANLIYYLIVARYSEIAYQYHVYLLPYAALGMGLGVDWLLGQMEKKRPLRSRTYYLYALAGVACAFTIVVSSALAYRRLLLVGDEALADCAKSVATVIPEDAHIIISTTSFAVNPDGTPNNYQEPQLFFYSHRHGWSLPADWQTPQKVEEYRQDGARYLVIYNGELYWHNRAFAQYLERNAAQIGPGLTAGCGIYQFLYHPS